MWSLLLALGLVDEWTGCLINNLSLNTASHPTTLLSLCKRTWPSHVHAFLALPSYFGNLRILKSALNNLAASPQTLLTIPRPSVSIMLLKPNLLMPSFSHLVFIPLYLNSLLSSSSAPYWLTSTSWIFILPGSKLPMSASSYLSSSSPLQLSFLPTHFVGVPLQMRGQKSGVCWAWNQVR